MQYSPDAPRLAEGGQAGLAAILKTLHTPPTVEKGVGDAAITIHLGGDGSSDYALAMFRNARVMMTDQTISVSPHSIHRLAVSWSLVKHIFKEMAALSELPIPAGLAT